MSDVWSYTAGAGFTLDMSLSPAMDIVCLDSRAQSATCEVVLQIALPADEVKVMLFASKDGRTRWRFWAEDPATGTDVFAEKLVNGVSVVGPVDIGDHNLAAGIPFYLTVRLVGNQVTVRVRTGTSDETASTYTLPDTDLEGFNRWGFESRVTGAAVLSSTLYQLAPVEAARTEVLVVVCGGLLYVCTDEAGELLRQVPGRVADSLGRVGIAEYNGEAYIVGGGRASIYDPIGDTLVEWSDDEHDGALIATVGVSTLPGAVQPTAGDPTLGRGTTGCTIIEVNNERVCLSGWSERPEVVFESESGNPKSYRLLNIEAGDASAFTINANDTVTCLKALASNNLLVGARSSVSMQLGDPLWGQVTVSKVSDAGISGPYAVASNDVGLAAYHSPAGLFVVPQNNALPYNFSSDTLTDPLQIAPSLIGNYTVSLVRDPNGKLLHTFLTSVASGPSLHFTYVEQAGAYQPGRGCLFPESYPDAIGPTASILWRGKVLLGTRNGLVLRFDDDPTVGMDTAALTGGAVAVHSYMYLTMVAESHPIGETILTSWRAVLSDDSDPVTVKIWAGATAETLFNATYRQLLFTATVAPFAAPFIEPVRGPAMALYIENDAEAGGYWELEQVVGNFESGRMLHTRRVIVAATPPRAGRPPAVAASADAEPNANEAGVGSDTSPASEGYGGSGSPSGGVKKA